MWRAGCPGQTRRQKTPISVSNISANEAIAASLASGKRVAVLIGDMALSRADASHLAGVRDRQHVRRYLRAPFAVGRRWRCLPLPGIPHRQRHHGPRALGSKAANTFVLIGCEPERDSSLGAGRWRRASNADKVVCLTSFASDAMKQYADVLLPIAPFTETSGTYVSNDGTVQSFTGVVRPLGETRPGWKVLRVLGDLLEADFSSFNSSEDVRNVALTGFGDASLGARIRTISMPDSTSRLASNGWQTFRSITPDAVTRRGPSLATSGYGKQPRVRISSETAAALSLANGARVKVTQGLEQRGDCCC